MQLFNGDRRIVLEQRWRSTESEYLSKKKQTKGTQVENCVVCHGFTCKHELMNEIHISSLLDSDERVFDTCNGVHLGAMQQSQVPSAVW